MILVEILNRETCIENLVCSVFFVFSGGAIIWVERGNSSAILLLILARVGHNMGSIYVGGGTSWWDSI